MAPNAATLRASLTPMALVSGYEAILDAVLDRFGNRSATACMSTTRVVGDRAVPSVIVVLDNEIAECWLTGNTVWSATTARPTSTG